LSTRSIVKKIGASRKHHKIRQLQQIITTVRHQGKTKTVNISLFFWTGFIENFKDGLRFFRRFKMNGKSREEFFPHHGKFDFWFETGIATGYKTVMGADSSATQPVESLIAAKERIRMGPVPGWVIRVRFGLISRPNRRSTLLICCLISR